jgi:hypothetical protein
LEFSARSLEFLEKTPTGRLPAVLEFVALDALERL